MAFLGLLSRNAGRIVAIRREVSISLCTMQNPRGVEEPRRRRERIQSTGVWLEVRPGLEVRAIDADWWLGAPTTVNDGRHSLLPSLWPHLHSTPYQCSRLLMMEPCVKLMQSVLNRSELAPIAATLSCYEPHEESASLRAFCKPGDMRRRGIFSGTGGLGARMMWGKFRCFRKN
jgi:hypothetical protein